jgi:DNA-3-methyladenine glycosylase II
MKPQPQERLNLVTLEQGVLFLCSIDPQLAGIYAAFGMPPLWERQPGFATLVYIILEQQVSLASARAAFQKLQQAIPSVSPENFISLDDSTLKTIGFSRQKTAYCRGFALAVLRHEIDLEALELLDDDSVRSELLKIKGIGPWTTDIYLLMALLRPDTWPVGDLALATAVQNLKGFSTKPTPEEMEQIAQDWKPWRAVAARLLWHYYLESRDNNRNGAPPA